MIASARPRPKPNAIPRDEIALTAGLDERGDAAEAEEEEEERPHRLGEETRSDRWLVHVDLRFRARSRQGYSAAVLLRRGLAVSLLALGVLAPLGRAAGDAAPAFRANVRPIGKALAARMTGVSWRPGCPVPLRDLRAVSLRHWGFDGVAAHRAR